MERTVTRAIRKRLRTKGRGWVFTPKEFATIGPRTAVDQALCRLQKVGMIRRLTRGLYEYPRVHPRIGILSPSTEAVAKAVVAKTQSHLLFSPSRAANLLGLSTQVPAQNIFLTEGPRRTLKIGNQTIIFKHSAQSKMIGAGTGAGIVIQAVRAFGPNRVNELPVTTISQKLSPKVKAKIKQLLPATPVWAQPVLGQISA